ncbi:MAG: AbrB/MazE/SpoVT family DNA-binding domain-containing protein [Gemmatimonadota bacterium]|nr:AbrB/MazE/SpoVT family DNA-binding domain-containing protein [Gemmatimonadota bacterium]MDE2678018.1 AbrB/MazE/SpoVT family DNA-binding domain-containing protein [Gemmatimonadota bacterium]MYD14574.1 AbrB/MazE/SpoVT family DNA-binding domain-containing protein [Gemmatimonadota bacterium]
MLESAVTKKGQTTLPKPVRDTLSVQAGDRVRYIVLDGEVRILPVRPIRRLFGALQHDGPPVTVEEMKRAAAEGAASEE